MSPYAVAAAAFRGCRADGKERMGGIGRLSLNRLFLWLSLATILTHALLPLGSPLVRGSGSAFSAYTSEVSLGSRSAPAKAKRQSGALAEPNESPDSGVVSADDLDGAPPAIAPPPDAVPRSQRASQAPPPLLVLEPAASPFHARAPPAR